MTPWLLALADDLTGALEVGAKFAGRGVAARVAVGAVTMPAEWPEPVVAIDTETRHAGAPRARATVEALARGIPAPLLYKKTDSTLRGNIAAEFAGLLSALPGRELVYVPAYPQLGRTVRGGCLHVDGLPLERTAFARDPLQPAVSGNIARMLGGLPVRIVDGETEAEVEAAAADILAMQPLPLVAGPAALAGALANARARACAPPVWPRLARCLVVNGSLHPASLAQVAHARECGWPWVAPESAPAALLAGGWCLLDTSGTGGTGAEWAARTGAIVRDVLRRAPVDGLAVFGGATAHAIHRALAGGDFAPCGEIVPGVPVSRCSGLVWVAKAGGFGAPHTLCDMRKRLT